MTTHATCTAELSAISQMYHAADRRAAFLIWQLRASVRRSRVSTCPRGRFRSRFTRGAAHPDAVINRAAFIIDGDEATAEIGRDCARSAEIARDCTRSADFDRDLPRLREIGRDTPRDRPRLVEIGRDTPRDSHEIGRDAPRKAPRDECASIAGHALAVGAAARAVGHLVDAISDRRDRISERARRVRVVS